MKPRYRPRRGVRARKDALGYGLIAALFVALAGAAAAGLALRPPPLDPETLCRTDAPVRAHTLILVDATDTLAPRHKKRVRAAVEGERLRLSPYDRLTLAAVRADAPQEPRLVFSKCLPRDGRAANPLFENAALAQKLWEEQFGEALQRAVRSAESGGRSSASPIVAALHALAGDPDFAPAIPERRLVLISDLLEHTSGGFSLYTDASDFAAFTAQDDRGPPDLSGVHVRVVPLDRPDQSDRQSAARRTFWVPFFEAADADAVRWDPGA